MARKPAPGVPNLDDQIREAIRASGRSLNQLGQESGVSAGQLSRFLNGERALSLPAATKVVRTLGLALYPVGSVPPEEAPIATSTAEPPGPPAKAGRPRKSKP